VTGRRVAQSPPPPVSPSSPLRLTSARRWALGWGLFLLTLTSWPKPPRIPIVSGIPDFDKAVHFGLYAVEAFLLYRAVRWEGGRGFSWARCLSIVGAMAVWSVADEVHQYWIPGRSMEGGDVAADVAGAVAGAVAASLASHKLSAVSHQLSARDASDRVRLNG
jgi:VanZ family protein